MMWACTSVHLGISSITFIALIYLSVATEINDNRPVSAVKWLFTRLGEDPALLRPLQEVVEQHYGQKWDVPEQEVMAIPMCRGCVMICGSIKTAIRLGGTFEKLRPQLLTLCKAILPNPDLICPGVLDNYGPHVTYILGQTNKKANRKTAQAICELMNHCPVNVSASVTHIASRTPVMIQSEALRSAMSSRPVASTTTTTTTHARAQRRHPGADVMREILASPLMTLRVDRPRAHARMRRHEQRKECAMKILQVADFHVDKKYVEGTPNECTLPVCCRKGSVGNGSAGYWGDYQCNVPPRTIELFLKFAADKLDPNLVIYSGDNPPHSVWEETYETQLHIMKWAANAVKQQIGDKLKVSAYPSIGNHETMPTNLYSMDKNIHRENMTIFNFEWEKAWRGLAGFDIEQKKTILKAGYYTTLLKKGLRLININSNYGYVDNFYNLIQWTQQEFKDMFTWFSGTLNNARKNKEKVIMVSHHDIGRNIIEWDERFTSIMAEYSDVIVFHPVGHTHRDEFRLYFGANTDKPAGMQHVSMTMNSWPSVNPGFRLYYLDKEDYTVLDYDQYYFNMETAAKGALPEKLYTFTEEYSLPDASADSHWILWQRLRRDPEVMQKYWNNKRLRTGADGQCDTNCTVAELCVLVAQSYRRYLSCVKAGDSITPSGAPCMMAATPGVFVMVAALWATLLSLSNLRWSAS